MSDDKTKKIPQDASRVDINDSGEATYWCKALGVTKERLEAAVEAVGTYVDDVRKYLEK